jgi:hypothetical protein
VEPAADRSTVLKGRRETDPSAAPVSWRSSKKEVREESSQRREEFAGDGQRSATTGVTRDGGCASLGSPVRHCALL